MTCRLSSLIRNLLPCNSLLCLICLLLATATLALGQAEPVALQHGSSVTREINPAESHIYELTLEAQQLINLSISAGDLNFAARLIAADGHTVDELVHRRYGALTWQLIAPEQGSYRLIISSLETKTQPRKYQLKVEQIRASTQHERQAAQAASAFHQAEVLRFKWHSSDLAQAAERYSAAADIWQQQERWAGAAEAQQRLGELHFIQGDYRRALSVLAAALNASKRSNDLSLSLTQLNDIAYVHIYLGELEQAASLCEQVQARLGQISASPASLRQQIEAQLQNNLGEIEYAQGNLKASLDLFARARAVWEEIGDRQGIALTHLNIGYADLDSGQVNETGTEFEQALQLYREVGDWRGEALTLTAQGSLYGQLGDKYAALAAHRTAKDIFGRMGDRQGEAITSNGLADVYEDLNLKQEAIDNYLAALRLNRAIGNIDFEAVGNYYLGRVYRDIGDLNRSLEYYEASLALSRRSGKVRVATHDLMDIAALYVKQNRIPAALRLYQQSLSFYRKIGDLRRQALTHHGLGELYRARGERPQALDEYRLGLELFQRIKDPEGEAESYYWSAKLLQEQGRLPEALAESEKSINLIEAQRGRVLGQNLRTTYFASVHRHFELYVDLLMQLHLQQPDAGFAALALQASERARARSLLELLADTQGELRGATDPSLLKQERKLRQQLSAKAAYLTQALNASRPEAEVAEIELEIRQLTGEYDFVQAQIKTQSPAYASLTQPPILTVADIQATLREDEGTVLLEYLLGDERSYLWLVTADKLIAQELPGRRVLETMSQEVYLALTARQLQPKEKMSHYHERVATAEEQFCPRATQLSQQLLGPLTTAMKAQRLLIVADGGLQYIPFDALPWQTANSAGVCQLESEPTTYIPLLTAYTVIHLPSFSSLVLLRQLESAAPQPTREIAIWADPVFESDDPRLAAGTLAAAPPEPAAQADAAVTAAPSQSQQIQQLLLDGDKLPLSRLLGTQEEAAGIMRYAPAGAAMLLTGFAANRESALERDLSGYRILHFATHALVDNRHPALSGLFLSTFDEHGHSQTGLLQMQDIYGLRLNADLVVLSACQTGLGEELSGEGVVGLTQGFFYAGSKSVVVSLWKVEDKATTTLMNQFYQAMLKEGAAPAEALRQAKLMMYRQSLRQSPYYWSAFVIQGEFRQLPLTRPGLLRTCSLWAWASLLAIAAWLFYSWRKRRRYS
jgi:CHAT domain-containing protein/tetratricopeptide (TPR) repeat protein